MTDKYQVLEQNFGYSSFREGQEPLIDSILSGHDTIGIMPTGAGKSLCFQVPALMLPGITLVISPLISLMKDQVNALTQNGVRAAYLNRSLTPKQYQRALENAKNGMYKIIYVAPERLLTGSFLQFAQAANLSMVTVDEAHCVSQWGQDFRPSYLQIPEFINALPQRPIVSAFTATATPKVREDILNLLALQSPYMLVTSFDRPNLYFEVQKPKDKTGAVLALLKERAGQSGIIYCSTRKNVELLCSSLQMYGFKATRYHAGLSDQERRDNQEDFLYDRTPIMVATNAFGMGIDKSNVSFVIHYNMPKDLESYYQEAGRAGRDGQRAECILLYSGQDVITNRYLLTQLDENEQLEERDRANVLQQGEQRLKAMTFYCHTTDCLRAYLLRYFGEQAKQTCLNCYNCLHLFETEDILAPARRILSCVEALGGRYGVRLIMDVLRGANTERIRRLGLSQQSAYGQLSYLKEQRLREIIQFLVEKQYLLIVGSEYPILTLGPRAQELFEKDAVLFTKLRPETPHPIHTKEEAPAASPRRAVSHGENPVLFEQLRKLRSKLAAEQQVPAYVVFSNATLQDMCARMPQTQSEFLEVSGVGETKWKRYGAAFLSLIREFCEQDGR